MKKIIKLFMKIVMMKVSDYQKNNKTIKKVFFTLF